MNKCDQELDIYHTYTTRKEDLLQYPDLLLEGKRESVGDLERSRLRDNVSLVQNLCFGRKAAVLDVPEKSDV